MKISGNTIFIPGSTSGIGIALAVELQAKGNTVIVADRGTPTGCTGGSSSAPLTCLDASRTTTTGTTRPKASRRSPL